MQLTRHSDYSLRVLTFLAMRSGEMATIPEIAEAYGISRAHLMKIVQRLGQLGYIQTLRGRGGGLLLGRPPEEIRLGELLRHTEENLDLVECFSVSSSAGCRIEPACKLKGILAEALQSFFGTLDRYTLADLVRGRAAPLKRLLQLA